MKIVYLPLPIYRERYTEWLSGPTGVFQSKLQDYTDKHPGIDFLVIRPSTKVHTIKAGVVLDPEVMCKYVFEQTRQLVEWIMSGVVVEGDAVYIEDFWHPGMEMIPYALSLKGLMGKVRLYAHCHAQTVDPNDFTAKLMADWMPGFEKAWLHCLDRIFVTSSFNRDLMIDTCWEQSKIAVVGASFDSAHIFEQFKPSLRTVKLENLWKAGGNNLRSKIIVYSSRLDEEKDPNLFMSLALSVMHAREDIKIVVCTSAKELRSNKEGVVAKLYELEETYDNQFTILTGLTKQDYYGVLSISAVQLNTALQDFTPMTLLEATALGCAPFYPRGNPSFDESIAAESLMYDRTASNYTIANKLCNLVDWMSTSEVNSKGFEFIYGKYNTSIDRAIEIMINDGQKKPKELLGEYTGIHYRLGKLFDMTKKSANNFDRKYGKQLNG